MDGVQIENGYTRIANEILEALAVTNLNGTQRRILDVVFRYTYGFKRKDHKLSISFIKNATGLSERHIKREMIALINMNILFVVKEATFSSPRVIAFNKDHNTWKLVRPQVTNLSPGDEKSLQPGDESVPLPSDGFVTQERNNKENIKEKYIPYQEILEYLNSKANKSFRYSSKRTKDLIRARWRENFILDDFKTVIDKKVASWTNTDLDKYLRPETLFGTKFEGYLNERIITKLTVDKPKEEGPVKAW